MARHGAHWEMVERMEEAAEAHHARVEEENLELVGTRTVGQANARMAELTEELERLRSERYNENFEVR